MENKTIEILKMAILMEKKGKALYETVAAQTQNEDVKKIFLMMAEEEVEHVKQLSEQFASFMKTGKFTEPKLPAQEMVVNDFITSDIKHQISAASFEAAAISAAINFENKAIEVYSKQAAETTDPAEKQMYTWLADWEKTHHALLLHLDKELTEKIWNDNQFWPF